MTPAALLAPAERLARWRQSGGWAVTVRVHDDPPPPRVWRDGWRLRRCDRARAGRLREVIASEASDAVLLLGDGLAIAHGTGVGPDDLPYGGESSDAPTRPTSVSRIAARTLSDAVAAIENIIRWESGDGSKPTFGVTMFGESIRNGESDVTSTLEQAGLLRHDARGDAATIHEVPWSAGDLVMYRGHGGPDGPSTPALLVDTLVPSGPPGRPIVAVFLGCSMGLERDESPSIASRLLCTPGGAVGVVAAVHLTAVEADLALFHAFVHIAIESALSPPQTLTEWLGRARHRVLECPPPSLAREELNRTLGCYRVFGDPTVTIPSPPYRGTLHRETPPTRSHGGGPGS